MVLLSATSWFDLRRSDAWAAIWSVTNWHVIVGGQDRLLQTIVGPLGPTWSLAVEEQFYVLLAIGVWLASRTARPVRSLAIGASIAVAASLALANTVSDWSPRLEFGTDVRAAELAVGCLLAIVLHGRRDRLASRARRGDAVGVAAVAGLIVLFLTAGTAPWLLRGGHVFVAMVSAAAITGVLAHGHLHRALAVAPLVAVGRWSYALYLVHWPVFLVLTEERTNLDGVTLVVVKLAVAAVLAVAVHLLVEQPIRGLRTPTRPTVLAWLGASALVSVLAFTLP